MILAYISFAAAIIGYLFWVQHNAPARNWLTLALSSSKSDVMLGLVLGVGYLVFTNSPFSIAIKS